METTVTETLSLGMLMCQLLLGTADCSEALPAISLASELCNAATPRYELTVGGATLGSTSIAALQRRLDERGACGVTATLDADGTLVLELATPDEPMAIVAPMLQPGALAFFAVDETYALGQTLPEDRLALPSADDAHIYVVDRMPLLNDAALETATAELSQFGSWAVQIAFTDKGADLFGEITSDGVGRLLAIVLDGTVISAPRIRDPILGGRAMITGNFSVDEARALAALIAHGPVPDGLSVLSIETVPAVD